MQRRTQFAHRLVQAFAARAAHQQQPLEMRHGLAQHRNRGNVRRPQPFQRQIETDEIAGARRVASFFDARFGLVAHDGAHVFERDLFVAARVQSQLFQFAPRHAAIRSQTRHRVFQGVGGDGQAFRFQSVAHHIEEVARGIEIAGDRCRVVGILEDFSQRRAFGEIAPFDHHQRVAGRLGQEGFEQLGEAVGGPAYAHHAPSAQHRDRSRFVEQARGIARQGLLVELADAERIAKIVHHGLQEGFGALADEAAVGPEDQSGDKPARRIFRGAVGLGRFDDHFLAFCAKKTARSMRMRSAMSSAARRSASCCATSVA